MTTTTTTRTKTRGKVSKKHNTTKLWIDCGYCPLMSLDILRNPSSPRRWMKLYDHILKQKGGSWIFATWFFPNLHSP